MEIAAIMIALLFQAGEPNSGNIMLLVVAALIGAIITEGVRRAFGGSDKKGSDNEEAGKKNVNWWTETFRSIVRSELSQVMECLKEIKEDLREIKRDEQRILNVLRRAKLLKSDNGDD